ncbi:MAG: FecR family protein [Pseudomonadota bacterium]
MLLRKRTAIKALMVLALAGAFGSALAAQVAGTVTNLSGPLVAKKLNGTVKVLAVRSEVEQGDTLVSERNTYAQIRFIDNSEMTLKPNTTFKIEAFAYDTSKPDADSASFTLVKGGLRSITGLLGKRNKEKFALKTPTATIGIRGTTFLAEWVEPSEDEQVERVAYQMASTASLGQSTPPTMLLAQGVPPPPRSGPSSTLQPGLHLFVLDGAILVNNAGGSQQFTTGQFGFVRSNSTPPTLVPNNSGLKFSPPPTFNTPTSTSSNSNQPKPEAVDCEVR